MTVPSLKSAGAKPSSGAPNAASAANMALLFFIICADEEIQAFHCARFHMNAICVSSNNKILNGVCVQYAQEVFHALGHHSSTLL